MEEQIGRAQNFSDPNSIFDATLEKMAKLSSKIDSQFDGLAEQLDVLIALVQSLSKEEESTDADSEIHSISNKVPLEAEAPNLFDEMPKSISSSIVEVFSAVIEEDQQAFMLSEAENNDGFDREEGRLLSCDCEVKYDSSMLEKHTAENDEIYDQLYDDSCILEIYPYFSLFEPSYADILDICSIYHADATILRHKCLFKPSSMCSRFANFGFWEKHECTMLIMLHELVCEHKIGGMYFSGLVHDPLVFAYVYFDHGAILSFDLGGHATLKIDYVLNLVMHKESRVLLVEPNSGAEFSLVTTSLACCFGPFGFQQIVAVRKNSTLHYGVGMQVISSRFYGHHNFASFLFDVGLMFLFDPSGYKSINHVVRFAFGFMLAEEYCEVETFFMATEKSIIRASPVMRKSSTFVIVFVLYQSLIPTYQDRKRQGKVEIDFVVADKRAESIYRRTFHVEKSEFQNLVVRHLLLINDINGIGYNIMIIVTCQIKSYSLVSWQHNIDGVGFILGVEFLSRLFIPFLTGAKITRSVADYCYLLHFILYSAICLRQCNRFLVTLPALHINFIKQYKQDGLSSRPFYTCCYHISMPACYYVKDHLISLTAELITTLAHSVNLNKATLAFNIHIENIEINLSPLNIYLFTTLGAIQSLSHGGFHIVMLNPKIAAGNPIGEGSILTIFKVDKSTSMLSVYICCYFICTSNGAWYPYEAWFTFVIDGHSIMIACIFTLVNDILAANETFEEEEASSLALLSNGEGNSEKMRIRFELVMLLLIAVAASIMFLLILILKVEAGRSIKPLSYTMSCLVLSWPNMCKFDAALCHKPFGAFIKFSTILEPLNGALSVIHCVIL